LNGEAHGRYDGTFVRRAGVMTVRRAAGYCFVATLAVVAAVGLPCGAWLPFEEARNSDGAWHFELAVAVVLSATLGVAVTVLAVAVYACLPSWRTANALVALPLAALLLPVAGCTCGSLLWESEFASNRGRAEAVIRELEAYRQEHGHYPGGLDELPAPPATTFRRGRYTHELKYDRGHSGGYTLEYAYGWYTYRYDPQTGKWEERD
jgi:hypothetical protein